MLNILAKLRTALKHKKSEVVIKNTKFNKNILNALLSNRLIIGFSISTLTLKVFLKYDYFGNSIIKKIQVFSKPGKRVYKKKIIDNNSVKNKFFFF